MKAIMIALAFVMLLIAPAHATTLEVTGGGWFLFQNVLPDFGGFDLRGENWHLVLPFEPFTSGGSFPKLAIEVESVVYPAPPDPTIVSNLVASLDFHGDPLIFQSGVNDSAAFSGTVFLSVLDPVTAVPVTFDLVGSGIAEIEWFDAESLGPCVLPQACGFLQTITFQPVPEPSSLLLVLGGIAVLGGHGVNRLISKRTRSNVRS